MLRRSTSSFRCYLRHACPSNSSIHFGQSMTMKKLSLILSALLMSSAMAGASTAASPEWSAQASGVTARLRGVSAVNDTMAWASGSGNTILRTTDGGASWVKLSLPAHMLDAPLDFRDIDALD